MKTVRHLSFVLLILLLVSCGPAFSPFAMPVIESRSPAATIEPDPRFAGGDGLGDPYFPIMGNSGYDVQHYTLDMAISLETNNIFSTVTIDAVAEQKLSQFNLELKGFEIGQVSVDGIDAAFQRVGTEFTVIPASPIDEGQAFSTVITYSGRPNADLTSSSFSYTDGWNYYNSGIMVAGEPSGSSTYYPVNEHPLDKATYTFIITVKRPLVVAANGLLIDTKRRGDYITYTWESKDPIASYLVTLAVGDFDLEEEKGPGGLPIRNYFASGISKDIRKSFDRQGDMIEYFSEVFGPYPFEAYGVVVHDLPIRFALETQTLSVFGRSFTLEYVVSHELSHSWFGDSVSLTRWQDIWLNEGFATYASVLWTEHAYGYGAARGQMAEYYETIAPHYRYEEMTRYQLAQKINSLLPKEDGTILTSSQVGEALKAIYSDQEKIDQVVSDLPAGGIPRNEFTDVFGEFQTMLMVSNTQVNQVLAAIGITEGFFETYTYPIPGQPPGDSLFNRSVYFRGALALHALREKVGDDAFFTILKTYASTYQYKNATIEDFITLSEEISGMELDQLFNSWLYDEYIPDLPELELYREDFIPQN